MSDYYNDNQKKWYDNYRKKKEVVQILLENGTKERIAQCGSGLKTAEFIRSAIEREIQRYEKAKERQAKTEEGSEQK